MVQTVITLHARPYGAPDVILGGCRVLQTCRPYGPQDSEVRPSSFRTAELRRAEEGQRAVVLVVVVVGKES